MSSIIPPGSALTGPASTSVEKDTLDQKQSSLGEQNAIHAALAIESRDQPLVKNLPNQPPESEKKPAVFIEEDGSSSSSKEKVLISSWLYPAAGAVMFSLFAALHYNLKSRQTGFIHIQENEPL